MSQPDGPERQDIDSVIAQRCCFLQVPAECDKRGILQANDHVLVNRGVTIGHDTVVEACVRLGPGCDVAGHVIFGRDTTIGIGATIIGELVIGSGAVVAACAAVINDIEAGAVVAGAPAIAKRRADGGRT